MPWFQNLCRNVGLTIHNIKHPEKQGAKKQLVSKKTEEKQLDEKITLRKTTIEEIEMKSGADQSKVKDQYTTDTDKFKSKYGNK